MDIYEDIYKDNRKGQYSLVDYLDGTVRNNIRIPKLSRKQYRGSKRGIKHLKFN